MAAAQSFFFRFLIYIQALRAKLIYTHVLTSLRNTFFISFFIIFLKHIKNPFQIVGKTQMELTLLFCLNYMAMMMMS